MHAAILRAYHARRKHNYPATVALRHARMFGMGPYPLRPGKEAVPLVAMCELALAMRHNPAYAGKGRAVWRSHYAHCRATYRTIAYEESMLLV
jgi:hypothetical protein